MGRLWDIIQRHIDSAPYPPSERQVARRLGVSPTTLANWRDPKNLPSRENLQAIAELVGVRYASVLDAALYDTGYHEGGGGSNAARHPDSISAGESRELRHARQDVEAWRRGMSDTPGARRHLADLEAVVSDLEQRETGQGAEQHGAQSNQSAS